MINSAKIAVAVLFCAIVSGCVLPAYRSHPGLETTAKRIENIVSLPPRVEVYLLETGGLREKVDEWSDHAQKNISAAVEEEIRNRTSFKIKPFPQSHWSDEIKSELEETYALFDVISFSILLHTHPEVGVLFEEKAKNFEYSLGEEVKRLNVEGVDAMLLVSGSDHIWSEGRKALQVFGAIFGIALGGGTQITAALLDARSGTILWYNRVAAPGGYDLRDRQSAAQLVNSLFEEFPIAKKGP